MKKLRILSLLLCLLMLLSSCVGGGGDTESSAPDSDSVLDESVNTDPLVENIDLVVDNKAQFVIISKGEGYASAAESLRTLLQSKTGVKFEVKKFDPSPNEGGKIYVGCDWCEITGSEEAPKYGY